jgi:hypothetical protein
MVAAFRERRDLALENLALRQQLGAIKRKGVPRFEPKDRVFWSDRGGRQIPNDLWNR